MATRQRQLNGAVNGCSQQIHSPGTALRRSVASFDLLDSKVATRGSRSSAYPPAGHPARPVAAVSVSLRLAWPVRRFHASLKASSNRLRSVWAKQISLHPGVVRIAPLLNGSSSAQSGSVSFPMSGQRVCPPPAWCGVVLGEALGGRFGTQSRGRRARLLRPRREAPSTLSVLQTYRLAATLVLGRTWSDTTTVKARR